ncbi:thiamine-repressible mitochondrial transport protein THI74-like [Iris pallida]|uniref:Thiamine-repressible mitochondrial transport protein THI74-like n=1 Tax=Iris pallida TaxID=29817 RepID=A0AAX6ESZ0_IRIPA|nr:thiamine-repressible mitochondrial transport protein THI74-like [Iris pallida]
MGPCLRWPRKWMDKVTPGYILGLTYIVAIAAIWIAASYIVQSVVDAGVSPFLVTYICNSLFVIYLPLVEVTRHFRAVCGTNTSPDVRQVGDAEGVHLLPENGLPSQQWTRARMARVSLLICPFWFFAQLFFNVSLKYTTVTSNTILSSTSSLFTFLVSLAFLGEKFTWVKLISVLLCMGGTIIVSLADSKAGVSAIATNPVAGNILSLVSAALYAVYITLIRLMLPDDENGECQSSTAQFLGFLGLFNAIIFLPVALVLHFTNMEPFHRIKWKQFGLIVGKGLLDNVLSDYLWVKATKLTTTTVATAGLSIQVPIAAIVDLMTGHAPRLLEFLGASFVMVGFAGLNVPSDASPEAQASEKKGEEIVMVELGNADTV